MDGLLSELLEMELAPDAETNRKALMMAACGGQRTKEEILSRAADLLLGQQG